MKIKANQINTGKMEREEAKKKKEEARLLREEIKRKKREERQLMIATKEETDHEKFRITLERLQLAWVKANITFIALGFTAYRVYQARIDEGRKLVGNIITLRNVGIFLSTVGGIFLLFATIQHLKNVTQLKAQYAKMCYSLSLRLSYMMLGFSVIVLLMMIFRI